jgi:hypothetical protein
MVTKIIDHIGMRVGAIFLNQFNVICPVQTLQQKYSSFHLPPNQRHNSRRPVPVEGRWPSSRTLGRDAVDAAASVAWSWSQGGLRSVSEQTARQTNDAEAYGKTVWSWHPLLVSSRRRCCEPNRVQQNRQFADDGDKTNSSPGRARHKP